MGPAAVGMAIDVQLAPQGVVLSGGGVEIAQNIAELVANRTTGAVAVQVGNNQEAANNQEEATLPPEDARGLAVFLMGR